MGISAEAAAAEMDVPQPLRAARIAWFAVGVAALGYFVDVFDMWLFANFRVPSLKSLGISGDDLKNVGADLQNCQQAGFLVGGFLWGIMGDKRGRVSVMFGSILLYSISTLLNSFVTSVPQYGMLRFFTGLGLAGEIGAGITLVSELLPKEKRGYGTTIVATLGVAGAIGAAYVGKTMSWQHAFILGGAMGFTLLCLRLLVWESGMYSSMASQGDVKRGSLGLIFGSWSRAARFICCIFAGVPIYLVFGLIVFFSPEIGAALGIKETINVPDVMLWASIGITGGDLVSGLLSQKMRSRKAPMWLFTIAGFIVCVTLCKGYVTTAKGYETASGLLGLFAGYWACLITTTAEQFGTNIRATVTTTVPNLVRASAIPLAFGFKTLSAQSNALNAALLLTLAYFLVSFVGLIGLKETYGKNLDYLEK
jgi:MFS family permease